MNLNVHRAMLKVSLERASRKLGRDLSKQFHPLWLGNWLADMIQASAFFELFDKPAVDSYKRWDENTGRYLLPSKVGALGDHWPELYRQLWIQEWQTTCGIREFAFLPESAAKPGSAQDIGGYHPSDHFDVVSPLGSKGEPLDNDQAELTFANDRMFTQTAYEGVFGYCLGRWLRFPFSGVAPAKREGDIQSARLLGQGLHILADFFGHTNFVELLIGIVANRSKRLGDLRSMLMDSPGTFSAYQAPDGPEATRVMSGRFDREDTMWSLLGIYQKTLIPRWNDLDQGGYRSQSGKTRDLLLEVLFGTFTQDPFKGMALGAVKGILAVKDALNAAKDYVEKSVVDLFAWGAGLFADDATKAVIGDAKELLKELDSKEARDFARAGRLAYVSHVIETRLRKKLADGKPRLPHHTLLAKDSDSGQPEVRLAYKMACAMACDVTTDVLVAYFSGQDYAGVQSLLDARYSHPVMLLRHSLSQNQVERAIETMYGDRWWQYAANEEGRIYV